MRKARLIALVAVLVSLVAMPAQVRAQSTLFTDALTGPASPNRHPVRQANLYAVRPPAHVVDWITSRSSGPEFDRPMVKTLSGGYLNEPQFTADLRVFCPTRRYRRHRLLRARAG